ncbi:MAG: hypothetical protein ISS57_03295 [Anaerolineales bacterium]|nr:hypothetical protein [Anaerolineales bacterium]
MKLRLLTAALLAASLACRPILTIGWSEIAILIVIIAVLMGPALFKLFKRMSEFQAWKANSKDKKKNN